MPAFDRGFALVIGIANYRHVSKLPEVVLNDAADLAALLCDPERCGYPSRHVRHLSDDEATAERIEDELCWLAESARGDHTALIYFSGHGWRDEAGEVRHYLLGWDAVIDPDPREGLIEGDKLTALLRDIRADRLVVILDCCHSGGTVAYKSALRPRGTFKAGFELDYYASLAEGRGRAVLASSRPDEKSLVLDAMRNSLFSHYLLEGLRGQAASKNGRIGIFELFDFVSEKVPAHDEEQHPIFEGKVENNIPIALAQGDVPRPAKSEPSSGVHADIQIGTARDVTVLTGSSIQGNKFANKVQ